MMNITPDREATTYGAVDRMRRKHSASCRLPSSLGPSRPDQVRVSIPSSGISPVA